jgi:hypothetical protein
MSITLQGYNRDASLGVATQVLGAGTQLVDKNGNNLVLPAGYVVASSQLRWLDTTALPTSGAGANRVNVQSGSSVWLSAQLADLTANAFVADIGAGSLILPVLAKTTPTNLTLNGRNGLNPANLDSNGTQFCVVLKLVPFPQL